MPNLTKSAIEQRAEELLDEAFDGNWSIPVDVEQLVGRLGGRIAVRVDGQRDPESLHIYDDGSFTVYVPHNTSVLRDRFTIAHELGHLVLHHDRAAKAGSFQRYGRSRQETEANAFAGALLMPANRFRDAWRQQPAIPTVARLFQVSQSAADVRCQVLRLS